MWSASERAWIPVICGYNYVESHPGLSAWYIVRAAADPNTDGTYEWY